jgi:hypothetical protein
MRGVGSRNQSIEFRIVGIFDECSRDLDVGSVFYMEIHSVKRKNSSSILAWAIHVHQCIGIS